MTRRPRVVLEALQVRPRPTGPGRSILELVDALAAADRGCDFRVLCAHPELFAHVEGRPGWRLVACPGAAGGTLRRAWQLQRTVPALVRRLGGDLLHCPQFLAPLRAGVPTVVTVHDLAWRRFPGTVEPLRRAYYRLLVGPTLGRAAAVLANSEATAAEVRHFHPEAAGRVTVTPFGLPAWAAAAAAQEGWSPAPGRSGRPRFLCVGTLEPRKNLEGVLRAYARFLDGAGRPAAACPSLLFVGGRGWCDADLRSAMAKLQAQGHLEVRGWCEPAELWRLYRTARALLFPSLHEGFGFPILEAMAAGLPVLTSARGAMAEVAGEAALLVDPTATDDLAGGMARLAWDEPLRKRLVALGSARARQWTWERTARQTCAAYLQVLAAAKK